MSSREIEFTKMHGIGNDYLYINCLDKEPIGLAELSVEMSDRHTGVGSDGIILICPGGDKADFKMRILNADGSEAKMCGNGIRCVGKYLFDKGITSKTTLRIDTLSGIKILQLRLGSDGKVSSVTVDMGKPSLLPAEIGLICDKQEFIDREVLTSGGEVRLTAVSMGNPHGVIFTDDLSTDTVHNVGRELESHPMWTDRANIEFAKVEAPGRITMRVWERGSGETMACGTGACAVAVAAKLTERSAGRTEISLLGGKLDIEWGDDGHVYMTGPAETIADGVYYRKHLPAGETK
ncbi:MAG: diaminopimelate epimerase [Paramuribaculum sp.]|nr:diaminopimelate epimerase [Paramuribaculum sp.]